MFVSTLSRSGHNECQFPLSDQWDCLKDNPYMAILTFLIGYNNLIPISLYMTTDLVRALQAFIMESDDSMYHKETESGCKVRSSGLCEDLGQVDFVLSDKTGTLTQNAMCFKACYVDGHTYGYWSDTADDSHEAEDFPVLSGSLGTGTLGYPSDRIERLPPRSICLPLSASLEIPWQHLARSTCSTQILPRKNTVHSYIVLYDAICTCFPRQPWL